MPTRAADDAATPDDYAGLLASDPGEWTALVRGQSGAVHGAISSRLHFGGPISDIGIQGRLNVADVHRWDLLPPGGQDWPLDIRGRLDLPGHMNST